MWAKADKNGRTLPEHTTRQGMISAQGLWPQQWLPFLPESQSIVSSWDMASLFQGNQLSYQRQETRARDFCTNKPPHPHSIIKTLVTSTEQIPGPTIHRALLSHDIHTCKETLKLSSSQSALCQLISQTQQWTLGRRKFCLIYTRPSTARRPGGIPWTPKLQRKLDVVCIPVNTSTWEGEAGGSEVPGTPQLHNASKTTRLHEILS